MTKEQLQKYAVEHGIFESLKANKNVTLTVKSGTKVAGFLKLMREVFPNNYVDKYGYTYTIYAGDKKTQEMLNKPIKSFNQSPKKLWAKARQELIDGIYNGFESKDDYEFVTSVVKKVTDGNDKIHTLSVRRVKKNLEVVLNDVRCTFENFDLSKAIWTVNGSDWKQTFEERITEQLNKVIEQEFK
jgi:hypothetical protein